MALTMISQASPTRAVSSVLPAALLPIQPNDSSSASVLVPARIGAATQKMTLAAVWIHPLNHPT